MTSTEIAPAVFPAASRLAALIVGDTTEVGTPADATISVSPSAAPPECDVLLNLGSECPPFFERYARLLEIVGQDDADRSLGRGRFKFYKERGYAIGTHDLGAKD